MTNELLGDIIICDPASVKDDVKPVVTFESGLGACFLTVHPVEEFKEFFSGREFYIKERISNAYSGLIPRTIGNIGTDSGVIGVYMGEGLDRSKLIKGENFRVRGFKGKIGHFYDKKGMLHLYGTGNYNFYTL